MTWLKTSDCMQNYGRYVRDIVREENEVICWKRLKWYLNIN